MPSLLSALLIVTGYLATLRYALVGMAITPDAAHLYQLWPILALQWLGCGLFITAHDACHGTAAPKGWPRLNLAIGRVCAALYAGFWFDALRRAHHDHHRHAGLAGDPDFADPTSKNVSFWRWGARFAWHYTTLSQWTVMVLASQLLIHVGHVPPWRVITFWAVPAWLSAAQLFYFGTYLPHRPSAHIPFVDRHRTRDSGMSAIFSLLSCYHFGYHQVHHEQPHVPWFALPRARAKQHRQAHDPSSAPARLHARVEL